MTAYTEFDNMERIARLETTVNHLRETNSVQREQIVTLLSEQQKQQAAINQLINVSQDTVTTIAKLAEISAGEKDDGL